MYLNLERFGTSEIFFRSDSRIRIGDLIYAIKSKRTNLSVRLKSAIMHSEEGVNFIGSCTAAPEVMEIGAEDIGMLLNELKLMGQFDYIIVDADLLLEGATLELMRQATANILVSNGEYASNEKLVRIHAAMDIIAVRDEISFPPTWLLYNRFSSKSGSAAENIGIAVLERAPRYEGGSGEYSQASLRNGLLRRPVVSLDYRTGIRMDKLGRLTEEVRNIAVETLPLADMSDTELEQHIERMISGRPDSIYLTIAQRAEAVSAVMSSIRGLGILDKLLSDEK